MKHQILTLKNGLKVILINTGGFASLTTILLVGAGSRYENTKNNGIAHFFEHMAFKGSKKYPSSFIIASTIEGLGGTFNAFTSKDHTGYWIKATNEHFDTVADVISQMVLHPLLLPEEINREKGVIIEELNLYEDTPYRKVGDLFDNLLYPDNPLGYDIIGTKEAIMNDDRDTFLDYIGRLYHPKNAVLVVAGGLDQKKDYLKVIEEKFGDWKDGSRGTFEKVEEKQKELRTLLRYKKTEQAHFVLGYPTFSFFDPRRYALSILSTILGGGMSSRLFIEVRERRGLAYYVATSSSLYSDVGNFATQAGVPNNADKIKEAIKVIIGEYKKVADGDVKEEEMKRAKELLKGTILLSLEDSQNVASFFGTRQLLEGKIITPQEMITNLEKVTIDDVTSLAKELFRPECLNFTMIGPFEDGEMFRSSLVSS